MPSDIEWTEADGVAYASKTDCRGRVHAHHAAKHGYGIKPDDKTCLPLCRKHHLESWHDRKVPPFCQMPEANVREWADAQIVRFQARYVAQGGVLVAM